MIQKINHIGIAVKNLDIAIEMYEKLGFKVDGIDDVPSQQVKVAFLPVGEIRIELLEPTSEDSPIAKFIAKKGEGIHHIAFSTNDVKQELKNVEESGIRLIDKEPRPGAHDTKIGFLHPKSTLGVLLEMCEESK